MAQHEADMATADHNAGGSPTHHILEYEQQILEELTSEDGLCITAAGLGWHRVVAAMLAMHDDPQHGIVLLLGTTAWQRQLICQELERINAELIPPADITADVPAWQRLQLYQEAAQQQPEQAQQQQQQQQQQQSQSNQQQQQQQKGQQSAVQIPGHDVQQQQQERQGQEQQAPGTALAPSGATAAAADDADAAVAVGSDAPAASAAAAAAEGPNSSTSQKKCAACFVTTRILVVDILSNRIRPQQIAGLIIINAHHVAETSGEGFAVRLYRQGTAQGFDPSSTPGNKQGFLRAFSDNPNAFASGFNRIEKVMKALRVRRLLLFPRFHQTVKDSLEGNAPELEEWEADPSPSQLALVEAVREVLSALLKELARSNRLDVSDLRPSEDLSRPLDRAVRLQLEPLWHTLTWRSRTAVKDLATVQGLVSQLLRYDAVTFLTLLEGVKLSQVGSSIWLLHEATHIMYEQARRRVYRALLPAYQGPDAQQPPEQQPKQAAKGGKKRGRAAASAAAGSSNAAAAVDGRPAKTAKTSSNSTAAASATEQARIVPVLEAPPKWDLLLALLQEVEQQRQQLAAQADAAVVVEGLDSNADPQQLGLQQQQQQRRHRQGVQEGPQPGLHPQQQQQGGGGAEVIDLLSSSEGGSDSEDDAAAARKQQDTARAEGIEPQQPQQLQLPAAAVAALRELSQAPLLVVCKELHSVQQLQQVARQGPDPVMRQLYTEYLQNQLAAATAGTSGHRGGRGGRGSAAARQGSRGRGGRAGAGRGAGAGAGRGPGAASSAGRGRGRGSLQGGSRREQLGGALWSGRGPAVNPAERQALLEAAKQLEQQQQQQGPADLGANALATGTGGGAAAAAAAGAVGSQGDTAVGSGAAGGRGRGRGRGRGAAAAAGRGRGRRQQQQQQKQHEEKAQGVQSGSDSEWSVSSDEDAAAHQRRTHAAAAAAAGTRQAAAGSRPQEQQQQQQTDAHQQQQSAQTHFYALDAQDPFVLWRLQPGFVILYDWDLSFLRQLEVYQAERARVFAQQQQQQQQLPPGLLAVRIFTASYSGPLEKAAFQGAVSRESSVFADLIRAKQHLVLPLDMGHSTLQQLLPPLQEQAQAMQLQYRNTGRVSTALPRAGGADGLWLDVYAANALSRVGGLGRRTRPVPHKVVVDVREFMSGLPAVLHQQGFTLTPMTLEVGDYVLSPDIVVERKALPDLFASLGSGRLYNQAEAMIKGYKTAILLIEFDVNKAFALTGQSEVAVELDNRSPQARLVLLLLHFPALRLVWSRSQQATGELFLSLKCNEEEPDAAAAALVGLTPDAAAAALAAATPAAAAAGGPAGAAGGGSAATSAYTSATAQSSAAAQVAAAQREESVVNQPAIDLLRRLPGVTDANYRALMNSVASLSELAELSCERLEQLMGGARAAQALYNFLHAPCPLAGLGPATLATAV